MIYSDSESDVEVIIGNYNDFTSEEEEKPLNLNPKAYTALCKMTLEGNECFKKGCTFAHTPEELRPLKCKYDKRCINEKCLFIHSKEPKNVFFDRLNKIIPPKKKTYVKPHILKTTPETIVEDTEMAIKCGCKYMLVVIK